MIANGLNKKVIVKEETTWGTVATNTGADVYRRISSTFNLTKESYDSTEIRTDYQTVDSRHGVRGVTGSLNGELSPGSYSKLFAAMYCKDFVAGATSATASLTIAVSGLQWTVTRAANSYLTDGFKVGSIVRLTTGTLNAANLNKNLVVTAVSALVLTVVPLNGVALVAEGPVTGCLVVEQGKKTMIPQTGHTSKSFTIEEYFSDIAQSQVYTGNKLSAANLSIPATGLLSCDFSLMGRDLALTGTSQYFTSPNAQSTSGAFASVSGVMLLNGTPIAVVTSMTVNMARTLTPANVVGSNISADLFSSKITTSGSATVYFQDAVFRDLFNNESEFSLVVSMATTLNAAADFISITIPRTKAKTFTLTDGDSGLSATMDWVGLLNTSGGTGTASDLTSISMQDSLAA